MNHHNNDNKFDLDLDVGVKSEGCLAELLFASGSKVEVKSEFGWWKKTGNVAIEYRCNGKPSGLAVTKAEWWAINFIGDDGTLEGTIIIPVDKLKRVCSKWYKDEANRRKGGDGNLVEMLLVPIRSLVEEVFLNE